MTTIDFSRQLAKDFDLNLLTTDRSEELQIWLEAIITLGVEKAEPHKPQHIFILDSDIVSIYELPIYEPENKYRRGNGYGIENGNGYGNGYGIEKGSGYGFIDGNGHGYGNGNGYGDGYGYGNGYGSGRGYHD